jgi:hypothetical protein
VNFKKKKLQLFVATLNKQSSMNVFNKKSFIELKECLHFKIHQSSLNILGKNSSQIFVEEFFPSSSDPKLTVKYKKKETL